MASQAPSPAQPSSSRLAPGLHHRSVASVTSPTPEDLQIAREDALLQLRIGRSAHYYALLVCFALALDGFAVLLFPPSLSSRSYAASNLFFLLPIVLSGLFLGVFALRVKWEEYQLWPWETHFWVTVLAVLVNGVAAYLFVAGAAAFGPTARWPIVPDLLPLAMGGASMSMAGLALTWTSRSERQLASLGAALLPFPISFVLFVPGLAAATAVTWLGLALLSCAILFQTSGSFLHLISSGTRAHEREMITSGQTRMFVLADQITKREESIRLREAALSEREAASEDAELSVRRRLEALDESRGQIDRMEAEIKLRSEALAREQTDWAGRAATAQNLWKSAEDKEGDLTRREAELTARLPGVSDREQSVAAREGEIAQRQVELARLQDEATRRDQIVHESESRLEARRVDLERRTADLVREESQFRSRVTMAAASEEERAASARRLGELEAREGRLNQLQIELDDLRATVSLQSAELARTTQALAEREERHARAEAELARRATVVDQREVDVEGAQRVAETRRDEYQRARDGLSAREQDLVGQRADTDRRLADLQRRELEVTQREQRTVARERTLVEREGALDRRERERRARTPVAESPSSPTPGPGPRTTAVRPAAAGAVPIAAPPPAGADGGARRLPDRISIGVPRLDDLLLGGLPPKAHLLLEGPPFSGKETLLYQFLAEGLRRGEPVVMLAGGRPAAEITEAFAQVLPEFRERQTKGQVLWVDTSDGGSPPKAGGARPLPAASADPATVLTSLVQAARKAEEMHPAGFRVGALGFAHLFSGVEPAKGAAFFQNFVGILKPRNALAAYAVDPSLLPEPLRGALTARADGVVEFREDRGKFQLAVRGLGEVETRDWVDYRASPQGITLGSFALERIR